MPLLIPPDPVANSYITALEADTILADFVQTSSILTFLAATVLEKEQALITATKRLEYECFKGVKTEPAQPLAFPRSYLLRAGTNHNSLSLDCGEGLTLAELQEYFYPPDLIPLVIKEVTALLAADYLANSALLQNSNASGDSLYPIKRQKVDVLEIEYFEVNTNQLNQGAYSLPPISGLALNLLAPLLCEDPYDLKEDTLKFRQVRRS